MIKVVLFTISKNGKLLVEKRGSLGLLAGKIIFPGGKIDEGESLEKALARECGEELGIKPIEWVRLEEFKSGLEHMLFPFLITKWEGEISATILDVGNPTLWVSLEEMLNSETESAAKIAKLLKNL